MKLVVDHMSARRDGAPVLRDVSFDVADGEFVGVVGVNGAGKTTLLRLIAGLARPDAGVVRLDGADVAGMKPEMRARAVSYLPQQRELYWDIDVESLVALGRFAFGDPSRLGPADRAAVDRAMQATGVAPFAKRVATRLSGGEQARAHLARALAAEAPLLLVDEPTANLDPRHQRDVMALLAAHAQRGAAVAALHDLALARQFCTRIVVLHEGGVFADGAPDAALSADVVRDVFGV